MVGSQLCRVGPLDRIDEVVLAFVLLEGKRHRLLDSRDKCRADLLTVLSINDVLHINTSVGEAITTFSSSLAAEHLKGDRACSTASL